MGDWVKGIVTTITVMFSGMFGGQKSKAVRRFGIPTIGMAFNWKKGWPLLFLIAPLSIGYGENSWLMDKIGSEFMVRLAYAFLLSLPFLFYGMRRWIFASVALVIAFQIHAGSIGHIEWFGDVLLEDVLRYGTLGVLIAYNLFF